MSLPICQITPEFARRMTDLEGEAGQQWLDRLPALLAACEARWEVTVEPPFPLSYNYVTPATRADGTPVVLKAGFPGSTELQREIEALRCYAGEGMARLLEADPEQGVMLLERLLPGTPLITLFHAGQDEEATSLAVQGMRRLWRPLPNGHPFRPVAEWALGLERLRAEFDGGTGPFPTPLVEEAERLFADLLASMEAPVLLHGDLHHENILAAERQPWLAIDPKGMTGEPAYEVGAILRNPLPGILQVKDPKALFARRVAQFSEELGIERERVRGWGMAQAVLSAWWSYEDHGEGYEDALACAALLAAL